MALVLVALATLVGTAMASDGGIRPMRSAKSDGGIRPGSLMMAVSDGGIRPL